MKVIVHVCILFMCFLGPASATNCSFNNGECYEFSQCGTGECCNSSNWECTTNCIHDNITDKITTEDIAGTALAAPQGSSRSLVSSLAVPGRLLNDRHRHPGAVSVVAVHLQTSCCLQRRRHALPQKLLKAPYPQFSVLKAVVHLNN